MRLTSKGRYAVAAMIDLFQRQGRGPVALAGIAERQFISLSYLEQLFRRLREAELVRSVRGPGGGYLLARPADEITIAEIIHAVDEPVIAAACENRPEGCRPDGRRCDAHELWTALGAHIEQFLRSVTLAQAGRGEVPMPGARARPRANRRVEVKLDLALS